MKSRRQFLAYSASTLASLGICRSSSAQPAKTGELKFGLIGCGGRGTGAAAQALKADSGAVLTAMGDVFPDCLSSSLNLLSKSWESRVRVTPQTSFVGLDAYQKVIDSGVDVVLLATPPGFRPLHLQAAIAAGKHVFCEKPMAVDAPGVRSVLASAAEAKRKRLSVVAGFCWRYEDGMREYMKRIHGGDIGDIRALYAIYYTTRLSKKFPGTRQAGWSDLEWQLRNWYNFHWLSGDHLVEQAVHNVDKMAWAMQDQMPKRALATGGRQVADYGNTFDHFQVIYEFASGARGFVGCRQQLGCHSEIHDAVLGSRGVFEAPRGAFAQKAGIIGEKNYKFTGQARNMFDAEHEELFSSIRSGTPINDGVRMANSTLMAIMGRMAAYTGRAITWEEAFNSRETLYPANLSWQSELPFSPRPTPGQTAFI